MARRPGRTRPSAGATISDVAEAAGVSRATVSRVMNGRPTVSPEIAARVRQVVEELGYNPSRVAQSLSLGKTLTVGVIVPDLGNPTFQQILHGVNQAAATAGYRVLVADSAESAQDEPPLVEDVRRRTDAVIVCSPRMRTDELEALLPRVQPAVLINRDEPLPATRVVVDSASGVASMCRHLIRLGHRRILHLDGPIGSNAQAARMRGLTLIAEENPDIELLRMPGGSSMDAGYEAFDAVMSTGATAVLGFNDLVSLGLLGAARERGVVVPDELSVAGFDDIPFARFSTPPLTTMSVDLEAVGEAAWRALEDRLRSVVDADLRVFTPALVQRASVGLAP
ncbi:LacI family DNA-binding transcriptional regulator [Demequina sp. SYSU T00192]|uniref:LacI family DNA-binding transcriptional regulator n=1 Tax=Demequina litoralis TaxID=3051660 RepID=A0ABT8GCK6_9MICO|nr:LacI family DNA-binding transcriptional regulator [Demequina sp. SYSU T00192]MDN4476881.1 LacI family DNA-binding transcriptional regulator [Demequina sp. SYSU T00192]